MRIMIVDSGARAHALSLVYEKSSIVKQVIVIPGNDFIVYQRQKDIIVDKQCSFFQPQTILDLVNKYKPDLIDVAQDDALALGTVDLLQKHGFSVFGPTKAAARIEWDKVWSKEFMQRHVIPTSPFTVFGDKEDARKYVTSLYFINKQNKVVYVKASGLCAGKGALRAENWHEAMFAIEKMNVFGDAGKMLVIENGLQGEEFSSYVISDGHGYSMLPSSQDHKALFNFDQGPQTGGMGAISPVMIASSFSKEIEEIMAKTISDMEKEGVPFRGILYLGGMVVEGKVMVIEFNARWGDPECHVILPSLKIDYGELVQSSLHGKVNQLNRKYDTKVRICVVGAERRYPESPVRGKQIYGLEQVMQCEGVTLLGAGIAMQDNKFYTNGGRLFSIVGEGNTLLEARQKAYAAIACIHIEGNNLHYRTDIGWRDMEKYI